MFKMEVQVRKGERRLRIKLNESTVYVIARVFNLVPERAYLVGDERVVVVDNLQFDVLEISPSVVYDVFNVWGGSHKTVDWIECSWQSVTVFG